MSQVRNFDPETIARKSATDSALRVSKLKRDELRSVNPRRDNERNAFR